MRSAAIVERLDISERCADNVRNLLAVARVLAKAARAVEAQTSAIVVDRSVIDDLIALVEKRMQPLWQAWSFEPSVSIFWWERKFSDCQSVIFLDSRWTFCLFSSGNLLNMIKDSGAEEHVVSLADWKSLGEPVLLKPAQVRLRSATGDDMGVSGSFMVRGWCDHQMVELTALVATRVTRSLCSATKLVNAGYSIEMRPTQSVLRRRGGGCILLQCCGKRDFLSIQVRESCEINAITFSTMKREVQSLKSELRALRTGPLSTSEVRLPWTPEEKLRHESNGHAEYYAARNQFERFRWFFGIN